jgi:hypothetical protein
MMQCEATRLELVTISPTRVLYNFLLVDMTKFEQKGKGVGACLS